MKDGNGLQFIRFDGLHEVFVEAFASEKRELPPFRLDLTDQVQGASILQGRGRNVDAAVDVEEPEGEIDPRYLRERLLAGIVAGCPFSSLAPAEKLLYGFVSVDLVAYLLKA